MTRLQIIALNADPGEREATVVLKATAGDLALGFLIPLNEANRLARVIGLGRCRCVPIYELIQEVLSQVGGSVSHAVLDGDDQGIYSTLVIDNGGSAYSLPSHPADAIALAVRANVPIYATRAALDKAHPLADGANGGAACPHVTEWLEQVKPEDFGGPDES